ncbi:hypothetical protein ACJBU6_08667 [Exserohilum turcicum]
MASIPNPINVPQTPPQRSSLNLTRLQTPPPAQKQCTTTTWVKDETTPRTVTIPCPTTPAQASTVPAQTTEIPAQASSTLNTSAVPKRTANGLNGGAVAGVAIGMFFAGLLIAGAVFFLLLRRQKRRQHGNAASHSRALVRSKSAKSSPHKGPAVLTSAIFTNIDDMIPQPVSDDTITDMALKIRDNIKNHARSYYHALAVPTARINEDGLSELSVATGVSTAVLADRLSDPSTRPDTLRLVIAWVLLSRCTGGRKTSLLPEKLAMLEASIPGKDGTKPTQSAMHSKWKAMTGALLKEHMGQGDQVPGLKDAFDSASAELDSIVEPFLKGDSDAQRCKNLHMILTRSAQFAFLLFSQPGVFNFDFGVSGGTLVAFPALVQSIGDEGQSLTPVRVLLGKELAA